MPNSFQFDENIKIMKQEEHPENQQELEKKIKKIIKIKENIKNKNLAI